jgi:nucleotide-binding universal stress UspA family protein
MLAWKRICCAVDFSETSRRALRTAAELAQRIEATLIVLHVRDVAAIPLDEFRPPAAYEQERAEAQRRLDAECAEAERLAPGRVTCELLEGDPAWEIVKYTQEHGQDVLVLGTHGRTGVRRLVVGSITEQVIRGANCPVLVVREPERSGKRG